MLKLLNAFVCNNVLLYKVCRKYLDLYYGENNDDMHRNGELKFLRDVLPACRVVFDVGANVGDWTKEALKINPDIQAHCFEPGSVAYRALEAKQFPPNVMCNKMGLSSSECRRDLHVFFDGAPINSIYKRQGLEGGWNLQPQQKSETVQLTTFDNYCHRSGIKMVDFLKIDVEGHEVEVLKGASRSLKERRIKFIQFEYSGCYIDAGFFLKDIFNLFAGLPYDIYKIYPFNLKPVERYDQRLDRFQYANYAVILKPGTGAE